MKDIISQNIMLASGKFDKEKEYWKEKLGGELSTSQFPGDIVCKSTIRNTNKNWLYFDFPSDITNKILVMTNKSEYGIFMLLITGINYLLYKYTQNKNIIVCTPIFKKKSDDMLINNSLTLKSQLKGSMTFKELLLQVKDTVTQANDNMNYPSEEIIKLLEKKGLDKQIIYENIVIFDNIQDEGLICKEDYNTVFQFSLTDEQLRFKIGYNSDTFSKSAIRRLGGHIINYFTCVVRNPSIKLSDIEIMSDEEKKQVLYEFNDTKVVYPQNKTIITIFEEQVEKNANSIAALYLDKGITYKSLNEKANCLARLLIQSGVCQGDIVGMIVPRSIDMVIAIIAILKAGAVCLPIDINYPTERIKMYLKDCNVKMLLQNSALTEYPCFEQDVIDINGIDFNVGNGENLNIKIDSKNAAFVIYTSGSTGKPKGVLLHHYGISNHAYTKIRKLKLGKNDAIAYSLNVGFVASIWQIIATFYIGARVVIYPDNIIMDVYSLFKKVEEDNITILEIVPTMLNSYIEILDAGKEEVNLDGLKALVLTGEKTTPSIINKFFKRYNVNLVNAYGQSECSDDTLHYKIPFNVCTKVVPIGRPANNTYIYVLDKNQRLQPIGVYGELFIYGDGLAIGYLNSPELDAKKFIDNPFVTNQKMYRTGDIVRWNEKGYIEFCGREDNQVKVRGFRIELGEIENSLMSYPGIRSVAVVVKNSDKVGKNLYAYLVTIKKLNVRDIREYLTIYLPEYMIPSRFIEIENMPLNSSGKIDRALLSKKDIEEDINNEFEEPSNKVEEKLVQIWKEILGVSRVGVNDDFYFLGGHSLLLIKLQVEIEKNGLCLDYKDLLKCNTIKEQAAHIKNSCKKDEDDVK